MHQLGKEERIKFREFVHDLKAKRDAGEIPSLSEALLKGGEGVVGAEIWRRALEKQASRSNVNRMPATAAASALAESSTETLDGPAVERALMDAAFRRDGGEPMTAEVPVGTPRGDAKLRAMQSRWLKPAVAPVVVAAAPPPPLHGHGLAAVETLSTAAVKTIWSELAELKAKVARLETHARDDDDAAVDLTDGVDEDVQHRHKRSRLGEAHDAETTAHLARVKSEKVAAIEEKKEALEEKEDAQETLGYQVRTTNALHSKIDDLIALALESGADPAAVNAIRDRPNYQ